MMRRSVVLPEPDGPSSAINSPELTSRLTLSRAVKAPNRLVTSCKAIFMGSLLVPRAAFQHHLGDQRDQSQQGQQRRHRERGHELVLVVENLDMQRHGV